MRELQLQTQKLKDAQGREFHCAYSILIDDMDEGTGFGHSYGIGVSCPETGERCVIPHITCVASRIGELSRLVVAGGVTPCALRDVVEDWL
ncbi:MAG: DUF6514 family protein [Oscillospiraceae bacterium]|nr:DUF6514 family protein [Oscillospiraceae bacterium]